MRAGICCILLASLAASADAAAPTFAHDIAPIIYSKCTACHYAGGPGPFPLTSYEEARSHAHQIAAVTRTRYMPPWLPEPGYGDFAGELRLSDSEMRQISDWVKGGALPGAIAEVPPASKAFRAPKAADGWPLGPPDLIVKAAQPYQVPASGPDVFWNFILRPGLTSGRYVRAIDIRPSNIKAVHHANLIVDRFGSQRAREETPGAGFPGMDVRTLRSPLDLDGFFLFWKPGAVPYIEPEGFSWRLEPGNDLILNTHLQTSGKVETEQPSVGIYFTDRPPSHFPYLLQLEHDGALDIPAGDPNFVIRDSIRLPVDTEVIAIYPHAHYLGKVLEAWAVLPDATRTPLIRIADWDQNWQAVYRYREPLRLPAGTVVSMRYQYDNSAKNARNPNHPPKRVVGGNQATDEMGHLWLEVLAADGRDERRTYAETWARHRLEKYPNDYAAEVTLGALELSRLQAQQALKPLCEAVRARPKDAMAHNLCGAALEATGRLPEALAEFRLAVEYRPSYANARFNLAHALARSGQRDAAIEQVRQILAENPDDPDALYFLKQLTLR